MPQEKASEKGDQPHTWRDQARRAAPYLIAAGGVVLLAVWMRNSGPLQTMRPEFPQLNPSTPSVGSVAVSRPARIHSGARGRVRDGSQLVSGYCDRNGRCVDPYLRPRARRGPESLSARQVAELVARG